MTNNKSQPVRQAQGKKGFAMPIIIVIVALVIVVVGVGYFATRKQPQTSPATQTPTGEKKLEEGTMVKPDGTMMGKPVTIMLDSLHNSGESGTAMLTAENGKVKVTLSLIGVPDLISQPAHIHSGSCPNPGAVKYPLKNVSGIGTGPGGSVTILDVSLEELRGRLPLAINVHRSTRDLGTYVACGNIPSEAMMKKDEGAMMNPSTGSAQEKMPSSRAQAEGMAKYTGTVLAGKSAPLLDFMKADYDAAVKSDKLVILYFYANWCPICRVEFPVMQKVFNELTTDKVLGFRVNYNDDQTDNDEKNLARTFGVAYQHTKVFVKNGKQILKAPDGWDDKRYDTEINKALAQ